MNFSRLELNKKKHIEHDSSDTSLHVLAKRLSHDSQIFDLEIRTFMNDTVAHRSLFARKMNGLLIANHKEAYSSLKGKYRSNTATNSFAYQSELVVLNQKELNDLTEFLKLLTCSYTIEKVREP